MNILIAPNAFKNSLDAQSVAEAIAAGLQESGLDCNYQLFPVGDGGDGTGALLINHLQGQWVSAPAHDALGRKITAGFGLIDNGQTAVIEMADASGIRLLKADELQPLLANTYGTGELIKAALDTGVSKIILGMGGSATIDGGVGILTALGVVFYDADDRALKPDGWSLTDIFAIDASGLYMRAIDCDITILCDVENPLIGADGAAPVFGPQKGAGEVDIMLIEGGLEWFAVLAKEITGKDITKIKHGGTAGGAAAGLYAFLNAKLVSGADHFLTLTDFESALSRADLVITAEGSIDEQTLQGKAPAAVAARARQKGIKVIGLAGKVPAAPDAKMNQLFDELVCINTERTDLSSALKNTRQNLQRTAYELGNRIVMK
ncbi:MAG: glycerate kinase [Bacteroidota bacterium]